MNSVKNSREAHPNYDDKWVEDREREVIGGYKKSGDWSAAKKIIENTLNLDHKIPRIKGLEYASGLKYDEIKDGMKNKI